MIKDERSDDYPGGSTPSQYGLPPDATDLQDLIEYREMNFALGNIFKACYRRGTCSHSDELRDMRKILWFAQREVDRLEREVAKPVSFKPGPLISLDELAEDEDARRVFKRASE